MSPSPTRALAHRWTIASDGVAERRGDSDRREDHDLALVVIGDRVVDDRPDHENGHECQQSSAEDGEQEHDDRAAVGTRERPDPTQRALA